MDEQGYSLLNNYLSYNIEDSLNPITNSLYSEWIEWTGTKEFGLFDKLKKIPENLKGVWRFVEELAKSSRMKIDEWVNLLKNSTIFKFFELCSFNLKKVYNTIYDAYTGLVKKLLKEISDYARRYKIVKWTDDALKKLDDYLKKNPRFKRIMGISLAAFLIYMNLHVTYIGDFKFDFDMTDISNALLGKYTLLDVLGGDKGIALLSLFVLNSAGLSFPWNTPVKLVGILGGTLSKLIKNTKRYSMKLIYNKSTKTFSEDTKSFSEGLKYRYNVDWDSYEATMDGNSVDKVNKYIESSNGERVQLKLQEGYSRNPSYRQVSKPIKSIRDLVFEPRSNITIYGLGNSGKYKVTFIEKGQLYRESNMKELYEGSEEDCREYMESVRDKYSGKGELELWPIKTETALGMIKVERKYS